ncbi:MAG: gliding motility-associated C-terminal domain-containing protein [Bacteroidota bacterium]
MPPNIGFEDGSFNHWNCGAGTVSEQGVISIGTSVPIQGRHTIFNKQTDGQRLDPYGKFPVVCPNGSNYSVRLGNDAVKHEAESLTYTFFVPKESSLAYAITFNYAVVLQNPAHKAFEQPRFTARIYDVTADKYVSCPSFDFIANSLPDFKQATQVLKDSDGLVSPVYYKDWSTATLDLHQYLGKLMRIEFTTNDCVFAKHFGYAYIDVDEGQLAQPIQGASYCPGQKSVLLKGPEGFANYEWYNADMSQKLSTGQYFELYPPPPNLTRYALKVTPYTGLGCDDIFYTMVSKSENDFKLQLVDTVYGCPETGVDLTVKSVTEGSTEKLTYYYFEDASLTTHLRDSTHVALSGTYYIQAFAENECKEAKPIHVKLTAPTIKITDPEPARYPETVDLTRTFVKLPGNTCSYYADVQGTIPLTNYTAIDKSGNYFVKVKSPFGCELVRTVRVTVLPPPPYAITAPNVFTPNNDGVNDFFALHIEGYVKFGNLDVFNRYGQLMYSTKSPTGFWDGNFKGKDLPTGTYYWIFNGLDTYYNTKIKESGSISIIR